MTAGTNQIVVVMFLIRDFRNQRFQNFRESYVVCFLVKSQFHTNVHECLLAVNNFSLRPELFTIFLTEAVNMWRYKLVSLPSASCKINFR